MSYLTGLKYILQSHIVGLKIEDSTLRVEKSSGLKSFVGEGSDM